MIKWVILLFLGVSIPFTWIDCLKDFQWKDHGNADGGCAEPPLLRCPICCSCLICKQQKLTLTPSETPFPRGSVRNPVTAWLPFIIGYIYLYRKMKTICSNFLLCSQTSSVPPLWMVKILIHFPEFHISSLGRQVILFFRCAGVEPKDLYMLFNCSPRESRSSASRGLISSKDIWKLFPLLKATNLTHVHHLNWWIHHPLFGWRMKGKVMASHHSVSVEAAPCLTYHLTEYSGYPKLHQP